MTLSIKPLVLIFKLIHLILILGSFVAVVQGQSLAPVSSDDAQRWCDDLHYLSVEMPKRHKNLFHSMTREQFEAAVSRLDERIPVLTRSQILVELARIVAMVGDGHTSLFPAYNPALGLHRYPIKFYLFKEGLYVQQAGPDYREVVGGKVMRIGNFDSAEAYRRMSEIVNRDNEMMVKEVTPDWLGFAEFLEGLGIVDNMEDAALTVDKDGKQIMVHLKPITMEAAHNLTWVDASDGAANPLPLWRKDPQNPYWFEYLKDSRTLYLKYNAVQDKSDEKLVDFFHRVFAFIDANPVDRLVIDIRNNRGGNGYLNWPLIYDIIRSDKINQRGKLFTITGRMTFSAAGMCAVYLERHTNTLFVGQPTGSSPNGYGDHIEITLPNSSIKVFVSTLYWQEADPRDRRPWIAPQIAADLTFEDYRNNVDPAMRAILSYVPQLPLTEVVHAAVLNKDVEAARTAIRKYRADPVNFYANFESDLNRLGYILMSQNQLDTAIQILRLNVESYPDSANAYDSLGEVYAKHGDRELAIKNYEKSIQLNPNNHGAEEALRRLRAH
ncbi:MAG: tetratricopeptide repeat protein [Terriglobales bacterium]|jgi:tetratricopeptide (TPR) repeat protein